MNMGLVINSLSFGLGWYSTIIVKVAVSYQPVGFSNGETTTERLLTIAEDNFQYAYRRMSVGGSRAKIKAGPGKGRLRYRPKGSRRLNQLLDFSKVASHFKESPIKLIGDWKYNPSNGTLRGDVTIDPSTASTRWGTPIKLIGFECEARRSRHQSINDMAG